MTEQQPRAERESWFASIATTLGLVLAAVLTVAVGVYLVSTSHPSTKGKTVIRWAVDPSPTRKIQIAGFESRHPEIKVINDPDATSQRLLTQLAGNVPPDVMAIYDNETARYFAKNGILTDLRPYVGKYHIPVGDLYKALDPFIRYKDQVIGIPENCGPIVVFYNRRLFREAHVPYPKPGWTWDQCLETAKKLTKYETVNGRRTPLQKGLYIANTDWWFFIWMYHGRMFSQDGKRCLMDSDAVKKGIRYWADLRLKYHVMPTSSEAQSMAATGAWGGDALLFREAKVAMVISGRWMCIQYREQKDLDWEVVSVPHGPNRVTVLATKIYAVPRISRHKHAALTFVANLLTKENQLVVANYGDGMPTVNTPEITKAFLYNPEFPTETNNRLHLDELKYARSPEFSPYVSNSDVTTIMSMELDRMWLGQQNSDQACEAVARQLNALIHRNMANPNFLN